MSGIAHLVDHRVTVSRLPHPDSPEAAHDEFNDLVEEWADVLVPAGLNARPDQNWGGSLTDFGPGEQQQALRRWFLVLGFDVEERDVLTVVSGPETGKLYRVESVTKPTNPFTVHHLEVMCSVWHGTLTPGTGEAVESGPAAPSEPGEPEEPGVEEPGPGPGPEPGPEPEPEPEPGPPEAPPPELLFFDDFTGGALAAAQNGVSWAGENHSSEDDVGIVTDATNPSGFALGFTFTGNVPLTADAWAEQRMRFPDLTTCYLEMRLLIPANYVHRNADGPDNNKLLRLWDERYAGTPTQPTWTSMVHVGMSTLPAPSGASQLIAEFLKSTGGTGNYGTGPWSLVFQPG